MDNFLPNDIAVMVLKYLASKGCSSSVSAMVEDMPALKFYVPTKPPEMTQPEYLRLLARPSFTPALEDVLNDYGRAKSMIAEIAESHEPSKSPIRPSDSMVTQLKQLSSRLDEKRISQQQVLHSESSALAIRTCPDDKMERISTSFSVDETVAGTSAKIRNDEDRMQNPESKELPLVIYNSLMNNSNLHEKIASVINEEVLDAKNWKSEGTALLKVRSKMESEVNLDKFLNELLKDGTNDFIDIIPPSLLSPGRSRHSNQSSMDGALCNLFQDADSVISSDIQKGQGLGLQTINMDQIRSVSKISPVDVEAKSSGSGLPMDISHSSLNSSDTSSQSRSSTSSMKPAISKKRIVPQPAAPCVKSNPVFETVQEFVTTPEGNKYTVKEIVPVISDWQLLGRRSIAPKIPTVKPTTTSPKSVTKTEGTSSSSVVGSASKRKKLTTPLKRSPDKASNTEHNFVLVYHDPSKVVTSSATTASVDSQSVKLELTEQNETGNATPTPLQQDTIIASNTTSKLDKEVESVSSSKEERLPVVSPIVLCKSETPKYTGTSNSFKASLSQMIEVTPILDSTDENGVTAPSAVSVHEPTGIVSPRLRRLIVSAQKARAPTTQVNLVQKSFSTPRKKKHVRNLHFTTPPSAKNSAHVDTVQSLPHEAFDVKPLVHKRKLGSDETDRCEEPPSKKLAMKSPEEQNDPAVYKSSAFPDRKFTCKYIAESLTQSVKKVLITKGTDQAAASKADTVRVLTQNLKASAANANSENQKSSKRFTALSSITEEKLPESHVEKRDKTKNSISRSENLSGIVATTSPQSVTTANKETPTPDVASAASVRTSVQSALAAKSNGPENKSCTAKLAETSTPLISLKPDVNPEKNSLFSDASEDLEEGECIDSNSDFPSPDTQKARRKSYNEQMLDLFGPMTPDVKVVKEPSKRNSSNDQTSVADKKSKPRDSAKEVASRSRKPSETGKKRGESHGSPETNRFRDSGTRDFRQTSNISSSKQNLLSTPERKEEPMKPSRASDRVREKKEREQEEKSRRQRREQELHKSRGERNYRDGCKDDRESELKNKRRTPKKNQIRDSNGKQEEKKVEQVSKHTKTKNSSLTPPSDQRKTPSRRTKQGIDVAAAKTVAVDAVAVCRNSSVSPQSPIKRIVKIHRESLPACTSDKQGQVKESVKTVISTTSSAPLNPVTHKVEATPVKEDFVPFSILPGPVGFPDPTPVKSYFQDYSQGNFIFQNRSLVTPIKTSQISPSASVPVTPKIVIHEDTESNSLSAFRSTEGMLWTPSKFFEPPPTPGRTIFVDERSQAARTAETGIMTLHAAVSDLSTTRSTENPLDLSSSPVASHKMQEILGSEQSSSSSSSESQSGGLTDSTSTNSSSDDAKKADDVHFQIPVGAPKKASPILPSLNKRSTVPQPSSSVQNSQRNSTSPVKKISSKESKAPIIRAQPVQILNADAESVSKSHESASLPVCDTTFLVKGVRKRMSASEHQPLVELAGSVGTNLKTPDPVEKVQKKSVGSDGTPVLQGGSKILRLLKKVDVNRFLTNVVHKNS